MSRWSWIVTLCLSALLVGCAGENPVRIAEYPQVVPANPPKAEAVVYGTSLEITVLDVDDAAEQGSEIVYRSGGYLTGSEAWTVNGRKNVRLELAIPSRAYEGVRRQLLALGTLTNEQASGSTVNDRYSPQVYSRISLTLRPGGTVVSRPPDPIPYNPPISDNRWSPARTARQAWSVFVSIFSVMADIVIWLVVAVGPFALLAWVAWKIVQRRRSTS